MKLKKIDRAKGSYERESLGMSEFINGISYVFYHNSYLKYYLFLIILMRIKRNSIHKISFALFFLLSVGYCHAFHAQT